MCATDQGRQSRTRVDVELVDQWHKAWPKVLDFIDGQGHREMLHIDTDGWLSARQAVLAAFNADRDVVGHAFFHIEPIGSHDPHRPRVAAHLDAVDIKPGTNPELRAMLLKEARQHARFLNCIRLDGFDA